MRYVYKSTKFQPRENRALTPYNRPSVSAPDNLADGDFCYRAINVSQPNAGFLMPVFSHQACKPRT